MVTPALRKLFAAEGIEVIGLAAGAKYLLRELATDPGPVEIVILGDGSVLPETVAASATPIAPALAWLRSAYPPSFRGYSSVSSTSKPPRACVHT
jgi:hypothetical protein